MSDPAEVGVLADAFAVTSGRALQDANDTLAKILRENAAEISAEDLRKVLRLVPRTYRDSTWGQDSGAYDAESFDVLVDPSALHRIAAAELGRREDERLRSEQSLSPQDWALRKISANREALITAIAERGHGPIDLDTSGHPRPGALKRFVDSMIDRDVDFIQEWCGFASPPIADAAKQTADNTAQGYVTARHRDLPIRWYEDVDTLDAIARTVADASADAFLGVLGRRSSSD